MSETLEASEVIGASKTTAGTPAQDQREKLEAEYREVVAVYGDATFRLKDLQAFVAKQEQRIVELRQAFEKLPKAGA